MKSIFYWGPFIENRIATVKAIKNSVIGINKYSSCYNAKIINSIGEWNEFINEENKKQFLNSNINLFNRLPKYGFIKSRISYLIISFISFFQLKKIISSKRPDFFIAHLLISVPLILFYFFNFKSKLIIRISGKPNFNYLRRKIWKIFSKNVHKVFCPTNETRKLLVEKKIFESNKIFILKDPIIELKKIRENNIAKLKNKNFEKNNIILAGRLTKQKNFDLIIRAVRKNELIKKNFKIFIFGNGELENELKVQIKKENLENTILLMGYDQNIFAYMKNSKLFILTSLWEDPGFVLVEAAMSNLSIIASDCPSGPKEIISANEFGGLLFKNNDENSLNEKLIQYFSMDKEKILEKKIYIKKNIKNFTIFNHSKNLEKYLN